MRLAGSIRYWTDESLQFIRAKTRLIVGDNGVVNTGHTVEEFLKGN